MKIWQLNLGEECIWCTPIDNTRFNDDISLKWQPKQQHWEELEVEAAYPEKVNPASDFIYVSGSSMLAADEKAKCFLEHLAPEDIEFLPVRFGGRRYFLLNVINTIKCLDMEAGCYVFAEDEDRILYIRRYAFDKDALNGELIFNIEEFPPLGPYVTDAFREQYDTSGLKGISFELVWDSEEAGDPRNNYKNDVTESGHLVANDTYFDYVISVSKENEKFIFDTCTLTRQRLNIHAKDSATKVVAAIADAVETLNADSKSNPATIEEEAIVLGLLYGECIKDKYGWKWQIVGDDDNSAQYAICSPDDYYCIFPVPYIRRILQNENLGITGENDNTVQLLFNMIESLAGRVPECRLTPLS